MTPARTGSFVNAAFNQRKDYLSPEYFKRLEAIRDGCGEIQGELIAAVRNYDLLSVLAPVARGPEVSQRSLPALHALVGVGENRRAAAAAVKPCPKRRPAVAQNQDAVVAAMTAHGTLKPGVVLALLLGQHQPVSLAAQIARKQSFALVLLR